MRDEMTALPGQGEARPERRVEPAVTIVVPTRNEAANVGPLVAELSTAARRRPGRADLRGRLRRRDAVRGGTRRPGAEGAADRTDPPPPASATAGSAARSSRASQPRGRAGSSSWTATSSIRRERSTGCSPTPRRTTSTSCWRAGSRIAQRHAAASPACAIRLPRTDRRVAGPVPAPAGRRQRPADRILRASAARLDLAACGRTASRSCSRSSIRTPSLRVGETAVRVRRAPWRREQGIARRSLALLR